MRSQDEPGPNGTIGSLSAIGRNGRNETGRDDETSQRNEPIRTIAALDCNTTMSAGTAVRLARLTLYSGPNCSLCDVRTT
jgi:hypothetical protein